MAQDGADLDPSGDEDASPASGLAGPPPHPRARLDTVRRVRREMARVYAEARDGRRPVGDAARLAYILVQIGRMIDGAELERRIEALEQGRAGSSPELKVVK